LIAASGTGANTSYQKAPEAEPGAMHQTRATEGLEELLWVLVYREGPTTLSDLQQRTQIEAAELERLLARLVDAGRIECVERGDDHVYQTGSLVVPLGSPVGWEAAVFDHFKALVNTVSGRLRVDRSRPKLADRVGGSTYTLDVWPGHPFEGEVLDSLGAMRSRLGELRERVETFNKDKELPDNHLRVVLYVGQCPIAQGGDHEGMG
jgi:hypothetical protein